MALTKAKLMELIDNGDIEVGGGGVSPNLLHNWDFRNPINQRGVSGTISTGREYIDRWIRNAGSVTINTGSITIANVYQLIELPLLAGAVATVSVMVNGVVYFGTGAFPTAPSTHVTVTLTGFGVVYFGLDATIPYAQFIPTSATAVQAVKLELGTVSTLHLDPPMDHAVVLPKCQRFYAPATGTLQYWEHVSGLAYFFGCIPLPVTMRINPTMVPGVCTIVNVEANMQGLITSIIVSNNREIREVRVNKSFTGSLGTPLQLSVFASADL